MRRWTHLDACEAALDSPLLYEAGWGKRLTYVLSFSRYGIVGACLLRLALTSLTHRLARRLA